MIDPATDPAGIGYENPSWYQAETRIGGFSGGFI